MAEINTRIILRNDTSEAWATENGAATPLKAGEAAVEIKDGKAKLKIATEDNQSFANAPYIGGAEANVFQVDLDALAEQYPDEGLNLDIEAAIAKVVGTTELAPGDIAIVKAGIAGDKKSYTSYVYDGSKWEATDGNYSAANVYTNSKITLGGDYGKDSANHTITSLGNKRIGDTFEAGTSLQNILMDILSKRLQPTTPTNPSATILFTNVNANGNSDDVVEIGTPYSAKFKTTFSDGKFTYDDVTGCQSTEATVTFGGKTKTITANSLNGATGTMDSVVIDSTSKKTFTLNYGWTASTIAPKDSLGDPATENTVIEAGTNSTTSSKGVSGYRKAFGGSTTAKTLEATSANIRALKSTANSSASSFDVTIDADANFVMIAVPDGRKVTKVEDGNAFGTDIFSEFTQKNDTVQVGGADATATDIGDYAIAYNVWTYAPSASLSANTYTVHIANE